MKLGLGTVQFGLDYGVSNSSGRISSPEIEKILSLVQEVGMGVIDTAPFYGDSETLIGQFLPTQHSLRIVTKVRKIGATTITKQHAEVLKREFRESLSRLQQFSIYGLLIHHSEDLLTNGGHLIFEAMKELQSEGLVEKIGISCYSREQIDRILVNYPVQILQVPLNIMDQRLLMNGYLEKIKSTKIEVHARSVFLQGLLLIPPDRLPVFFNPVRDHLKRFHSEIALASLSPIQACLSFVLDRHEVDAVICGVTSFDQLTQLVQLARSTDHHHLNFNQFACSHEEMLNPTHWPSQM